MRACSPHCSVCTVAETSQTRSERCKELCNEMKDCSKELRNVSSDGSRKFLVLRAVTDMLSQLMVDDDYLLRGAPKEEVVLLEDNFERWKGQSKAQEDSH